MTTQGNETETFHDQKPTHPTILDAVISAAKTEQKFRSIRDEAIEQWIQTAEPVDFAIVAMADVVWKQTYHELLTVRELALNPSQECTCGPDDVMVCKACKATLERIEREAEDE